jgi:PadR family transcriptional regulator, regulatory protein PadR
MPPDVRLSHQTLRVLKLFLDRFADDVRAELVGADIMKATRLQSGTLYPILLRLEKAGVLTSRWEDDRAEDLGRPRRRFYRITPAGVTLAHDVLKDLGSPLPDPLPRNA